MFNQQIYTNQMFDIHLAVQLTRLSMPWSRLRRLDEVTLNEETHQFQCFLYREFQSSAFDKMRKYHCSVSLSSFT